MLESAKPPAKDFSKIDPNVLAKYTVFSEIELVKAPPKPPKETTPRKRGPKSVGSSSEKPKNNSPSQTRQSHSSTNSKAKAAKPKSISNNSSLNTNRMPSIPRKNQINDTPSSNPVLHNMSIPKKNSSSPSNPISISSGSNEDSILKPSKPLTARPTPSANSSQISKIPPLTAQNAQRNSLLSSSSSSSLNSKPRTDGMNMTSARNGSSLSKPVSQKPSNLAKPSSLNSKPQQPNTQIQSRKRKIDEEIDLLHIDPLKQTSSSSKKRRIGENIENPQSKRVSSTQQRTPIPQKPSIRKNVISDDVVEDEDLDEYEEDGIDDDMGLDDEAAAFFSQIRKLKASGGRGASMGRRAPLYDDDDDCMEATQEEIDEEEMISEKVARDEDKRERFFETQRRLARKKRKGEL